MFATSKMDPVNAVALGCGHRAPLGPGVSRGGVISAPQPGSPTPPARDSAAIISFPIADRGPDIRKAEPIKILFVCRTHAVLSPMAEGLAAAAYERLDIAVRSAGLSARGVDPRAVAAMAEIGLDISQISATEVRDLDLGSFDIVVSLGVHKLGLHAHQMAVAWDITEFTRVTEATALSRLKQVRDAISVRVRALGAILTATNRA